MLTQDLPKQKTNQTNNKRLKLRIKLMSRKFSTKNLNFKTEMQLKSNKMKNNQHKVNRIIRSLQQKRQLQQKSLLRLKLKIRQTISKRV